MKKFLFIIFIFALGQQNVFAACTTDVALNNQEITNAGIITTTFMGGTTDHGGVLVNNNLAASYFHMKSDDSADACFKLGNYSLCTGQHSDSSRNLLYVMYESWNATKKPIFSSGSLDMGSNKVEKPYIYVAPTAITGSGSYPDNTNGSFYVNGNLFLSNGLKIYNDSSLLPDATEFKGVYFHSKFSLINTSYKPASVYVEGGNNDFTVSEKFVFSGAGYHNHCNGRECEYIPNTTYNNTRFRGYLKLKAGKTLLTTIMTVTGDATNADLAELFPISDLTIKAGDILAVDTENKITLKKGEKTKRSHIVGVVSTNPALIFEGDQIIMNKEIYQLKQESKTPLALAGRVPVKISLEGGPIKIGDPITVSSKAGVGMKANESGMIVGIALDDYEKVESNNDKIYIFVNTKWYTSQEDAKAIANMDQEIQDLEEESVALEAEISAMYNTILNLKKQGKL